MDASKRYLALRGEVRPCLIRNRLGALLGLSRSLSRMGAKEEVIWTSGDATPSCLFGANWGDNEYAKLFPRGILQESLIIDREAI